MYQYHEELMSGGFGRGVDGIEGPSSSLDQFWISTGVKAIEERFDDTRVGEGEDVAFVSCMCNERVQGKHRLCRPGIASNRKKKKTRGQRGQKGEVSREGLFLSCL
jgi:hypothetical protein